MIKMKKVISWLLTMTLLLTMPSIAEMVVESSPENSDISLDEGIAIDGQQEEDEEQPEMQASPEDQGETEEQPEIEDSAETDEQIVLEESEIPSDEGIIEQNPVPAAPEVIIAPEWEYDEEIGAITIPYIELPEMLRFEWKFEGEASEYAVQLAPVPEGDNPEIRSERIYTSEPRIELPAMDYSEGGWFSLYVIAVLEDGAEVEGWKYFRLEKRENASLELVPLAGQSFTIRNVKLPFSLPTSDNVISASGKIGWYNGTGCWAFASYVYYRLFGRNFDRTDTSDFITTPGTVVKLRRII